MATKDISWDHIESLEEHFITYLLYMEGKSIPLIAKIRRLTKLEVEQDIIKSKIMLQKGQDKTEHKKEDILIKIISMDKKTRLDFMEKLRSREKEQLAASIYKRYIKFKNPEDRMILIWVIGELKDERLIPFLRMELKSHNVNFRRLACSALGKIGSETGKGWLEYALMDDNPQVRQYAIKALAYVGDKETISKLNHVLNRHGEKDYVIRAAKETIEKLKTA